MNEDDRMFSQNHRESKAIEIIRELLNQLETNYQQAIEKGHHWPNERVNMTSAIKLRAKKFLEEM